MTSEVGTDLRAVHVCGVPCLQVYRVRKRSMSPYVGAFGEIAPPRRCSGKAEFAAETGDVAR